MRRVAGDDGAVAVLVAILAVALFGFGAIVIDVGALYNERRELQNGADAGALAVGQACAGGDCGTFAADADTFSDQNARDVASRIPANGVCGTESAGLPACIDPPAGLTGNGYVRVTTRTEEPDGSPKVPPLLARVLDPDYDGTEVGAQATVIWGAPGGLTSDIPLTISACEWKEFTAGGLAPPPDYSLYPTYGYSDAWLKSTTGGRHYERTFYTHNASKDTKDTKIACPSTAAGGDAAGSFGWLDGDDDLCAAETTLSPDGELGYENDPGNDVPSECHSTFPKPGTIIFIPVHDYYTVGGEVTTKGGGNHVWYHVDNYAAFYITGYHLKIPTKTPDYPSIVTGKFPCKGEDRCISGFFTTGTAPSAGPVVAGTSYGANITQLVS